MEDIVQLINVSKSYSDAGARRSIFKNISLDIQRNISLAVVGRSGSGKSTLLNLLSGIDTADSGKVIFDNQDYSAINEKQRTLIRRKSIGFIFQSYNLIPSLTVRENLLMPLELSNSYNKKQHESLVNSKLLEIGLENRCDSFPEQLSGGEQQRVAVARAIIHKPDLILADEPTGNLDEENGGRVLDLLFNLVKQESKTLILVTHSLEVANLAESIIDVNELNTHKNV